MERHTRPQLDPSRRRCGEEENFVRRCARVEGGGCLSANEPSTPADKPSSAR